MTTWNRTSASTVAGININPVAGLQLLMALPIIVEHDAGININPVAGLQHNIDDDDPIWIMAGININPVAGLQHSQRRKHCVNG